MRAKRSSEVIKRIIKLYGPVIDLRANPEVMIDILRQFDDVPDGGTPCGGVPPPPPPPPPSAMAGRVTNEDLLKAVLKLTREVSLLTKSLPSARRK